MAQNRVYEDIQPSHAWARDERSDTLILHLEGFSRSQLKVQMTSTRKIRVSGERQKEGNNWCRFTLEFPVPADSDTNDVGAKFEKGTLFIRFPKLIAPATVTPQRPSQPPTQQAPPPPPPPPPPLSPPKPTTREEPKAEEAMEKKPETKDETKMEQKEEKKPPKEKEEEDISEGKELKEEAKAKASETEDHKQEEESIRGSFSERLSSMQVQDYKDAIVGLVAELKQQKNVINKFVLVFVVLLIGLYLKHLVKSTFGGSKSSHQEL